MHSARMEEGVICYLSVPGRGTGGEKGGRTTTAVDRSRVTNCGVERDIEALYVGDISLLLYR